MAGKLVLPRVHVMVMCDEIADHPGEEYVYDLHGVRSEIHAIDFPYRHSRLCVFLHLTGHEGTASLHVLVIQAETDAEVYSVLPVPVEFQGPNVVIPLGFWLDDCVFRSLGVYYVQVFHGSKLICERALHLLGGMGSPNGQDT